MLPKLLLAVLLVAVPQRGVMPPGAGPTQFEEFAKKLKLDDKKQLPDVQAIFQNASADASPFEREMMRLRLKMLDVADKPAELAPVQQEYAVVAAKMTAVEVKAFEEVRTLLKSSQLSKSTEAFALMAGVFHPPTPRMMGRRGGGDGPLMQIVAVPAGQRPGMPAGGGRVGGPVMSFYTPPTRLALL